MHEPGFWIFTLAMAFCSESDSRGWGHGDYDIGMMKVDLLCFAFALRC